ncbi:DegV family protein [Bacillus sp. EB106-08-02-XG196]|uniref:DegV family protein n=1 Tax=Bacillus sp. EB106-08-02-XG196 TaxID=2737049 RepID=UPI0015C426EA|nr:DegV family protein [Bacillus sp. EB106-08-02-XG196]NWQ39725.1 DegV family protein [Bacillus sp. EB106-08-02-XG196]
MTVSIDGHDYLEKVDLTPQDFFHKMFSTEVLPKTSQPAPASFAKAFSQFGPDTEILCFTIASGLSGTYQSVCIGKDLSKSSVNPLAVDTGI